MIRTGNGKVFALGVIACVAGLATRTIAAAPAAAAPPALTAQQVIDRYVAACGGAGKWRDIKTMAWNGHVETGSGGIGKMPFMMLFRRPDATRFEILQQGQRSVRVFDGTEGWRMRPTSTGLPETKAYGDEEVSFARDAAGLDGPLFDHEAKGVKVVLEGLDSVEGHAAYRLGLTLPSGRKRTDWIDAHSFLELRYDREMRNAQGITGTVAVYYRNYQAVEGLTMPFLIETGSASGGVPDKMVIEQIALNPTLPDNLFAKPTTPEGHRRGVVVDATRAQ